MTAVEIHKPGRKPVTMRVVPDGESHLVVRAQKKYPFVHLLPHTVQRGAGELDQYRKKIPHPFSGQEVFAAQQSGEAGVPEDAFSESLDGLFESRKPELSTSQLENAHRVRLAPSRKIDTRERTIHWTANGRNVLKIDWIPVPNQQAEERMVTNNMVALLMGTLGYKGVPFIYDSGTKPYHTPDGAVQEYTYILQEAIPTLDEQGRTEASLKRDKVPVYSFSDGLQRLDDFGIKIELYDPRKLSNYVTTVRENPQTGGEEVHQVFIDNLGLVASEVLTIPVIKGIRKIIGTIKNKEARRDMEVIMGGYLQRLLHISDKYAERPEEKAEITGLIAKLGVSEFTDEIIHHEIPVFVPQQAEYIA